MSVDDEDKRIESAVLGEVLALHPTHLTVSELVQKMSGEGGPSEEEQIRWPCGSCAARASFARPATRSSPRMP